MEELYCGDCLDVLDRIPANSVDLYCSDPPYRVGILRLRLRGWLIGQTWCRAFQIARALFPDLAAVVDDDGYCGPIAEDSETHLGVCWLLCGTQG